MNPSGVAVVTGSSRGIGRAVAVELARLGFDVHATMRDTGAGGSLPGEVGPGAGSLTVERLDVTDPSTITFPRGLRVLVNNAGVEDDNLPIEATPLEVWRRMFETNVFGVVSTSRAAIPRLRESGGGVICNITSSSVLAPVPFMAPYRASKAAVSALGESLQAEVAQFGIRVVEIMPGPIQTDMLTNSERPAAAIEHAEYRNQAERLWDGRQRMIGHDTPAAKAAAHIAEAILDENGPLRHACDPLSVAMLAGWRSAGGDQEWLGPLLESFG